MSDLQAYLASKYMSGPKADAILEREDPKRRKKKRKVHGEAASTSSGQGLVIADEDGAFGAQEQEEEEYKPGRLFQRWPGSDLIADSLVLLVVEERRGHFKAKAKADSWATIRDADPTLRPKSPTPEPEDEAPAVAGMTVETAPRGGLQSAADLRAEQERKAAEQERKRRKAQKEEERRRAEARARGEDEDEADPHATVYRDATGKRIDVKLLKAEQAKEKRQELEKQMAKMEWGKGLVQRDEKERKAAEAERLKNMSFARCDPRLVYTQDYLSCTDRPHFPRIIRYADDQDMNNEMKDVERWNDPAAAFLTVSHLLRIRPLRILRTDLTVTTSPCRRRRRRAAKARNTRRIKGRHRRRTVSASARGIDGTASTAATALRSDSWSGRTRGRCMARRLTPGAWRTCSVLRHGSQFPIAQHPALGEHLSRTLMRPVSLHYGTCTVYCSRGLTLRSVITSFCPPPLPSLTSSMNAPNRTKPHRSCVLRLAGLLA
jgi:pre-mRNA-splicing factor CWC26